MNADHIVTILTVGAIPLFLGLLAFAQDRMKRADKRRDDDEAREAAEKERAQKVLSRYQHLREFAEGLRYRSIRRFQAALSHSQGDRRKEADRVLEEAIKEFEDIQLPPSE